MAVLNWGGIVPVSLVGLDYWNTLYRDVGTPESRRMVREKRLKAFWRRRRRNAETFGGLFTMLERTVKDHWKQTGTAISGRDLFSACRRIFQMLTEREFDDFRSECDALYRTVLRPQLVRGAHESVKRMGQSKRLFLVSDTFVLRGRLLRIIMEEDGLLQYFSHLCFSDEMGAMKPSPAAFGAVMEAEACRPSALIYVGDNAAVDGGAALAAGVRFILFGVAKNAAVPIGLSQDRLFVGVARTFEDVEGLIRRCD